MVHQIFQFYVILSVALGLLFVLIGKPIWNLLLLLFCIPFENSLVVIPQLSLIKAMSVITFISLTIHRSDFISFIVDKLVTNKFFLAFVFIFVASAILARDQGNLTQVLLGWIQWIIILVCIWYTYLKEREYRRFIEKALIVYGVIVAWLIFAVQGFAALGNRLFLARFLGPNTLAPMYLGLAALAYGFWQDSKSKIYFVIMLLFSVCIILTGNRSIPLGFGIFLVYIVLFSTKINKTRIIIFAALFGALFLFLPFPRDSFLFNVRTRLTYSFKQMYELATNKKSTITAREMQYHTDIYRSSRIEQDARWQMYREAMNIFKKNPILGAGPGNTLFERRAIKIFGKPKGTHSTFSEILLFYGTIGILLYLIIIFSLIRMGHKYLKEIEGRQFLALIITFAIDGLFHINYQDSVTMMFLAITGFNLLIRQNELVSIENEEESPLKEDLILQT